DRATGVAEEQRSGGIGADELDLDFYAAPDLASPQPVRGVRNRRELCLQPGRLEGDVDEPGRRHRGAAERRRERHRRRQLIGNGDRRPAERPGELQRQRYRVVAMGGVLGPLHQHRRQFSGVRRPARDGADGVADRLVDDRRRRRRRRRDQGCVPSVTWSVWFLPPRLIVTETLVPGAYWRSTSFSGCESSIDWPLTLVMTSWTLIPARSAGDPGVIAVTTAPTTSPLAAAAVSSSWLYVTPRKGRLTCPVWISWLAMSRAALPSSAKPRPG